jgi:hypothetical protein
MIKNELVLSGTVEVVKIETHPKGWINGKMKLKTESGDHWISIKGLTAGHRAMQLLPELKGKHVMIDGRLSSWTAKARPPEYPDARTFYEIAMGKNGYMFMAEGQEPVNRTAFGGKVQRTDTDKTGVLYAEVGIPYKNPKTEQYGSYYARVRCPSGVSLDEGEEIYIEGTIEDRKGAVVNATRIVQRPR